MGAAESTQIKRKISGGGGRRRRRRGSAGSTPVGPEMAEAVHRWRESGTRNKRSSWPGKLAIVKMKFFHCGHFPKIKKTKSNRFQSQNFKTAKKIPRRF